MDATDHIRAALERLLAGTATEDDRSVVRSALQIGVLVTGARAVAIGGDASDLIITTGDGNTVLSFSGTDSTTVQAALNSITPTRLHQVPSPPRDFTGREQEIRELFDAIERGGITISGLQGMGGIGKTVLALKLAEQLTPKYPDAQFYLDLKGMSAEPLSASEAMSHVIRAYHPAVKLPATQAELQGLYQSVLHGQRALLLMDNAANAEQVEPLIPPASCGLIVTSRQHFSLPGLFSKNLATLGSEDARKLLLTIAPRIRESADDIARLCGCLPLALRLAGGALAQFVNIKPNDYAQRLRDAQLRLQLIEASLSLSFELLSEPLQLLWRSLAVFPDSFDDAAASAVWQVPFAVAQNSLSELLAASLVEFNETNDRYRLHDLARLFANSKLTLTEQTSALRLHAKHYQLVLAVANRFFNQGGDALSDGLRLFDLEATNIFHGQVWAGEQPDVDDDAAWLTIAYPNGGAQVLGLRQHALGRIKILEASLEASRRLKHRDSEGHTLGNLGIAYMDLGENRRAIRFLEGALLIAEENGEPDFEASVLGTLGVAYKNLGENEQAIVLYERARLITCKIGDRRSEGGLLSNLGVAYKNLGENRRAIEFYEQALLIARDVGDRRGEGTLLGNLGNEYKKLRETDKAIELHKEHLTIAREIGDRRSEGIVLGNLGIAYADLGETEQALDYYDQDLAIAREIGDRRGEGTALFNRSLTMIKLGDRAAGIASAETALDIFEQIEDPNVARVRDYLALWREGQ